jgi:hypothetical protein
MTIANQCCARRFKESPYLFMEERLMNDDLMPWDDEWIDIGGEGRGMRAR